MSEHLSLEKQALSDFAELPTVAEGPVPQKPFGKKNYRRMKDFLEKRVGKARFQHSVSVAKTAKRLAEVYKQAGIDPKQARMAGLVHDWDKALSPQAELRRVERFGIEVDYDPATMPWLLHGPTAARVLAEEFPELGDDVFQAVERHTVGAVDMTPLDMMVYVADKIEPGQSGSDFDALRSLVGTASLAELFFEVHRGSLSFVLRSRKPMNMTSVTAYNAALDTVTTKEL